ncbi:ABC transporter related protein [Desulfonatronospira thiodismutans ASO3-1]|uniref:ABC transporter related protein n=1 Tax=Desulfonatronospira thiodismutans ASO3-1 TaxID=555779 RepID=D6SKU8_9BACT|nr:ABC transporter ATP-binding protein [Desulfonatronospira thiodismutans]EFI35309.1 ABC transporter related protein [Desulfonatronospira thiodismutans ASO3-1]
MKTWYNLYSFFSASEKWKFLLVLAMILIMALLEVAAVASLMPFLAVLGNPEAIETNIWLNKVYVTLNFSDKDAFLFFLGMVVLCLLVVGSAFKSLTTWAKFRFIHMRGYSLSQKMLRHYLSRPYTFYLNRNSSDLIKNVLSEVDNVIRGIMVPGMEMATSMIVVVFMALLLFLVDPVLVFIIVTMLSLAYLIIYKFIRHKLNVKGKDRVTTNMERYSITQEVFGGIKDVKLLGLESKYQKRFSQPAREFYLKLAFQETAAKLPKFFMEAVVFGGIVILALYFLNRMSGLDSILPVLGMFAFAGYKIMPALQQIFSALTKFRFSAPALDLVHRELNDVKSNEVQNHKRDQKNGIKAQHTIMLDHIYFAYPGSANNTINDLTLQIRSGSVVGLVGSTGSGKTTLVDILLGLLTPDRGEFMVDKTLITPKNIANWQNMLGYVPQNIYLSDTSVASNIAFGLPDEEIDMQRVVSSSSKAKLHDFITHELPGGYNTVVGERGIRLSGGQRQRIGIARALYREPQILVLDEATSALDNITEKSVMEAIAGLEGNTTVIIIAHRLSTVEHCDMIHILEQGRIKTSGTYEELLSRDHGFQMMVMAARSHEHIN